MKRTAIAVIVGMGMLVTARAASAQATAERGMKVYADQKCTMCHAIAGKGNAKGALDGVGTKLKADEIRRWIVTPAEMATAAKAERKPAMKAYPSLPKEDLDALVGYLASLKTK
jgi:mono/diheme cytochrome c family protein